MAYSITTSLGEGINYVGPLPYWDNGRATISPALGTVAKGNDGHDYVLAQASAAVASGATVVLTEPAFTFATGAGAWTAPVIVGGVPSGQYAWLRKTAI